ncbi:PEP-CTERM sorting domain-containing protein [Massilia sp. GCM10023247]|uniref:PEP-CTERM sorting domain-containing protein n=1 Tax=Massilia sp. GCM10023247 TaxID=3252643 RepID=UPI00361D85E9
MKIVKKMLVAALCSLAVGAANANVITIDQEQLLASPVKITATNSFGFNFNLTSLLAGWGVSSSDIFEAYLNVFLNDPGMGQNNEQYTISVGTGADMQKLEPAGNNNVPNGNTVTTVRIDLVEALNDLKADGLLNANVALRSRSGDFFVTGAHLYANFNEPVVVVPPVDVPEPASAALLGLGMLGFLAARRRRA